MKHFFKNKKGMTYVELLVAFTLLMLIVFVFSPMLLSSYNTLYKAGEKNVDTYNAKSEIEEGLAKRVSTNMVNFTANFEDFVDNINVKGRKVASTAQKNLETMFHGARASVAIISSSVVNDDSSTQEVIIQTTNIKITECKEYSPVVVAGTEESFDDFFGGITSTENQQLETPIIVCALFPNKTAGTGRVGDDENVYNINNKLYRAPITIPPGQDFSNGRVKFTITDCNFTKSPIKILVYFRDEKGKLQNVSCYLYIKAPTIMAVGKTGTYDYYTTAGVETSAITAGSPTPVSTFEVEGRAMPVSNSTSVSTTPKTNEVTLKNVSFINNDADKSILDPYYVVTGTKGTIYRMYCFNKDYSSKYSSVTSSDKVYMLNDGSKVYPSLWGGDKTHQFGYSTYGKSMGYTEPSIEKNKASCWYTQSSKDSGVGKAAVYGTQAKYAYYYNGFDLDYAYSYQMNRKISYVLTEASYALRINGCLKNNDSFTENSSKNYNMYWEERVNTDYLEKGAGILWKHVETTDNVVVRLYEDVCSDKHFSFVRLKAFTNLPASKLYDGYGKKSSPEDHLSKAEASSTISVTGAVYDEGLGGMFYCGTVAANALMFQSDNTSSKDKYARQIKNNANIPEGSFTGFFISGNSDSTGTTIRKYSGNTDWSSVTNILKNKTSQVSNTVTNLLDFYYNRGEKDGFFPNLKFTFGFSSNREKVFGNITYKKNSSGSLEEAYRSYEKYYFLSHYGSENHDSNYFSRADAQAGNHSSEIYKNSADNDYYNIWFPGEFYNIVKVASKEGITIGVGYTVSGSVYQWINPSQTSNSSTAVGSVYNDGILAVKSKNDAEFSNVLYFKDNGTFDGTSIWDGTNGKDYYKNNGDKIKYSTYGLHSRQSVQFTAVDLMVESSASGEIENKSYYAYYGDNTGRVFKSKVASATAEFDHYDEDDKPVYKTNNPTPVEYIADLTAADTVKNAAGAGKMEEVTVGGSSVSTIFSEIVSITAGDDLVVITGKSKPGVSPCVIIGCYEEKTVGDEIVRGDFVWREVQLTSGSYEIQDGIIVNGYYYACGVNGTKGFILGADLVALKNTKDSSVTALICETNDPLYSISGRA